ncbi:hypothetical protein Q760_02815 [Cellulomonas cellasea DSM 20118]|uniref:Cobalt transporter n=2 Tax=Cellulomonas cellasea TaxID=43670 RepID=A0A0A0B331_9CELL|nr:hypothetical protein [Cellulomonas cellasea]KGM01245.1 hypothetical protein Q760_02815 [Cellulomonas cellasea DSM 20118]GEA89582.1 hypothetical protein CCE01nite_35310 [Cellulomonas cellasea]
MGAVVVGLGLAVTGVVAVLNLGDSPQPVAERCAAALDGTAWYLSPEQADNAALLTAQGLDRGLPARAATIAIATALQESKLSNITYGDRDSLGLFQQRPSQGWGTPEEIMDPVHATGRFYDGLVQVPGYDTLPVTEAAQAVQRSGYPDAYAQHEARARAWASALAGWSPATLTCTLRDPDGAGSPEAFAQHVARDHGGLAVAPAPDAPGELVIDARPVGAGTPEEDVRAGWALAQWAVAVARPEAVIQVRALDQVWDRASGEWAVADAAALPAGEVRVTLAGP